ncbi:hypothetical protein BS329_35240 [Amycolatopsis coloradensis]|uniref:Uncharacterized protein n=1 Tax=Amycolatopsis coloradensis TaxID=76021 RepID=A0A1R0KH85_9PSEU|nr:hypothetical protein [Amycolatopsis coloradensis]OLZ45008.1 hypothetical protein BS329_35240 [Amycolatopsis coloradensis]
MSKRNVVVFAATTVVLSAALLLGWWWATVLVAAFAGFAVGKVWLPVVAAMTAWATAILWTGGAPDTARVLSAMVLANRDLGWLVLVITAVYAALLASAGAWTGATVRRVGNRGPDNARG